MSGIIDAVKDRKKILFGVTLLVLLTSSVVLLPLMVSDICLRAGISALDAGSGEGAGRWFAAALFFDDDNPDVFRMTGEMFRRAARTEQESFYRANRVKKVIRSQPPVRLSDVKNGMVYDEKVEVRDLTPEDVKKNIRNAGRNFSGPQETVVYVTPRYPGSSQGLEKKAVNMYRRGLALNPRDARMYHGMAEMMEYVTASADAMAVFRKAVELDPNDPNIRYSFALFCLRNSFMQDAVLQMRCAVSIYPAEAARAYAAWIENGGLVDDLESVAGTTPTGLFNLGLFFERMKEPGRAAVSFERACMVIGGDSSYRDSQEMPPGQLLPQLLEKLALYGNNTAGDYYRGLWERDLARTENDPS